jgi:hypothetical protein
MTSALRTTVCLLAALVPAVARADAPSNATPMAANAREAARGLAAQALSSYDAGDLAVALPLFEKADALYPTPQYRVYIARAYAKLGQLRRAVAEYDEALLLPLPPEAPPSFVDARKTALNERTEAEKRLAIVAVEVSGAPSADVTIKVDGEAIRPEAGGYLMLDAGHHRLAAKAPTTSETVEVVELTEGRSSSVRFALTPLSDTAGDGAKRPFRALAIASGAVGASGLVLAVASGAVLAQKRGAILDACPSRACSPDGRALIDGLPPVERANLAGWIAAAAGGAFAAAFVTLDHRAPKTTVTPAVLPGGAFAFVTRKF